MVLEYGDERDQVIKQNPKHLKCPKCGHEEDIFAAAAIPMGEGKYNLIFGSDADFCTQCEEPWGRNAEPAAGSDDSPLDLDKLLEEAQSKEQQFSQEDVEEAMKRYPGYPTPLAMAKYMMDKILFGTGIPALQAGLGWGGVHLERVGQLVQMLAEAVYHQYRESITIKLTATDYPDTYDHWWVEVVEVKGGKPEVPPLAGWPCCSCKNTITAEERPSLVLLKKKAMWTYPSWGNVLNSSAGRASAVLCEACTAAGKQPEYAIKKEGDTFDLVPLSELEDLDESCQEG